MSAYAIWLVACAVDGRVIDFDLRGYTMGSARENARAVGWKTGRGTAGPDYCPDHRPDRNPPISGTAAEVQR